MIDAIVAGRVQVTAVQRTSSNGNQYVEVQVLADVHYKHTTLITVQAFNAGAKSALLSLAEYEQVILVGSLSIQKAYESGKERVAVHMIANRVLTVHRACEQGETMADW